ncbi:cysteinyl-tRNA synthetase [Fulvimarina pelagi HTCC2506]|uniref:Cysteine--tRNA ligase n=1 Tax=Fulvimarina pelagi HTCC2506 TaxID=314231 RepID=Q0G6P1_9HYPH|nr:cysteine--tRNA ligase [Fulvimarina pelagi]EAU42673.1 cysteinyl-tRNA synthetase [Fulvimarina pelagi HTCC2506]
MRAGFRGLRLSNTMTRQKEDFVPLDWRDAEIPEAEKRVRMYVCGPTVYDYAHIGNARPMIVFDVLFRLLRHLYGEDHVVYARNITDVDDKINARAARDFPDMPLNDAIRRVTTRTTEQFHTDIAALCCLPPTVEPRATDYVSGHANGHDMVAMIETLIEKGHAYEAGGEVLFDVTSMPDYGSLSKRRLDEQQAGARVAVDSHKRNPGDFVLWKLSDENEPGWGSPWGRGRPGWHIECSVMSEAHLGKTFDIHGGGLDLIFPHHENEIAQSRCAHGTASMAEVWMHNGYVQVEGRKMSKSEGNFITIHDLLHTEKFGGRKWPGEVLRLAMLMTHYREPIDFSVKRLEEAAEELSRLAQKFDYEEILNNWSLRKELELRDFVPGFVEALEDDLNISLALRYVREAVSNVRKSEFGKVTQIIASLEFLGIFRPEIIGVYSTGTLSIGMSPHSALREKNKLLNLRAIAANTSIRDAQFEASSLSNEQLKYFVSERGIVHVEKTEQISELEIQRLVEQRLAFIGDKNWAEADRIRDELAEKGIQLKDSKDPETGERLTTWELKR